jgi:hypothetical protein
LITFVLVDIKPKNKLMDYSKYKIMYLKLDFDNQSYRNRLVEDMEYYLLEEKVKKNMLYYFEFGDAFYFIVNRSSTKTMWDLSQLQFLITNAIRKNRYILMGVDSYTGYHHTDLWDRFDRCENFYNKPKETRKIISEELVLIKRARKLKKIQAKIDEKGDV